MTFCFLCVLRLSAVHFINQKLCVYLVLVRHSLASSSEIKEMFFIETEIKDAADDKRIKSFIVKAFLELPENEI